MKEAILYRKEGQSAGMVGTIIALVIGVGVAILILIFVGILSGTTFNLVEDDIDAIANNQVTGDTFTALNNTVVNLDHAYVQEGTLTIQNSTANSGTAINLNNFTIDYDAGTVLLKSTSDISLNNTDMLANYTWGADEVRESIRTGIANSFDALNTTGDYMPIVVLAIVIALVLGIIMTYIAFSGKGSIGRAL